MSMLVVGGRNPFSGEFSTLAGVIDEFDDDNWTAVTLDFGPVDLPRAFRAQNNQAILAFQHSVQAFFRD